MTFISTTFGIAKADPRIAGIEELNNMITDMIFMVTMVLWKEQPVSYLSMRYKSGKY